MSHDLRFSVLIPARRASRFIVECLESVASQRPFVASPSDYEILVGVDACASTLATAMGARTSFPRLRLFSGTEQRGAYVMRNTLSRMAMGRYFIFFDADDVMLPGLVEWCERNYDALAPSRFLFKQRVEVFNKAHYSALASRSSARGVFGIRREAFEALGGFRGWPCSADTEFHARAARAFGPPLVSPDLLFIYRRHNDALTRRPRTRAGSLLRKSYQARARALAMRDTPVRIDAPVGDVQEV